MMMKTLMLMIIDDVVSLLALASSKIAYVPGNYV